MTGSVEKGVRFREYERRHIKSEYQLYDADLNTIYQGTSSPEYDITKERKLKKSKLPFQQNMFFIIQLMY